MPRKTGDQWESTLPEFELLERSYIVLDFIDATVEALLLKCSRCDGTFIVSAERFFAALYAVNRRDVEVQGRPCPYCFAASLRPPVAAQG